ncbi:MAG: flagellar hook-basal body complex protein FliE [Zoogloeaceae bacterium]|jgi:flagellar hook-basal body complex protein FliE|nr:flagellar hook-basal body complex protein FliE [Zoogloeaceae bacterium]
MDTKGMEQMLALLHGTAAQAAGGNAKAAESGAAGDANFAQALKNSIDQVNNAQKQATQMAENLAAGNSEQNLHEVMIALQTASISFQEMVQVRNRLVSAYQDVMNMQV